MLHQYKLGKKLSSLRAQGILTDLQLTVNESSFKVHSSIFRFSSTLLDEEPTLSEIFIPTLEPFINLLPSIIDYIYGVPLPLKKSVALSILKVADELQLTTLQRQVRRVLTTWKPCEVVIEKRQLLEHLQHDLLKDFTIVFGNREFQLHKIVLAAICKSFYGKFTATVDESGDTSDYTELLKEVDPNYFESFLKSFYEEDLQLTRENCFHYANLANYFHCVDLSQDCNSFLQQQTDELVGFPWLVETIEKAIYCEDYIIVSQLMPTLSKLPKLKDCQPIVFTPETIHFFTSLDPFWLLKCFVHSITTLRETNNSLWTDDSVQTFLDSLCIDDLYDNSCAEILSPLIDNEEPFLPMFKLVLTVMKNNNDENSYVNSKLGMAKPQLESSPLSPHPTSPHFTPIFLGLGWGFTPDLRDGVGWGFGQTP
ncbi:hypothetical protein RCL1_004379 [Eukaryota sp. TZLM3-RCL]